jgi:hypothetical protein
MKAVMTCLFNVYDLNKAVCTRALGHRDFTSSLIHGNNIKKLASVTNTGRRPQLHMAILRSVSYCKPLSKEV